MSSPVRIADDAGVVALALDLLPLVPTPVWGRDKLVRHTRPKVEQNARHSEG